MFKTPTKNPSKLGVLQEGEEPSISHPGIMSGKGPSISHSVIVGGEGPSAHRQSFVPIINPPSPPKSILKKNKTQGGKLVTWKDRISNPPPYKDTINPYAIILHLMKNRAINPLLSKLQNPMVQFLIYAPLPLLIKWKKKNNPIK